MKRALVQFGLIGAFIFAIALSVSPQLHERIHGDASQAQHHCAVTLLGSGTYENTLPQTIAFAPPVENSNLTPRVSPVVFVPATFLSGRIFEHGPPRIS